MRNDANIPLSSLPGANVFIASNGHLKLGDFGLSFQLQNASRSVMDAIGDNVGTVPYMAPEVIRSGKTHHIGRASDIWSVGCTVVEMITGKVSQSLRLLLLQAGSPWV